MKLLQEDLPEYQRDNAFRGCEETDTEWLDKQENQKYLMQTGEIYGCVSEKEVVDQTMILTQIIRDNEKLEEEFKDSKERIQVTHHLVDFQD